MAKKNFDNKVQNLLEMEEKEWFANSVMFMFGKIKGIMDKTTTIDDFQQSKVLVNSVYQARKLMQFANKPLPKYPEHGWLFPYLYKGSCLFDKRWEWWSNCLLNESVSSDIPQISFNNHGFDKGVKETVSHIEGILQEIEQYQGRSSLAALVQWLLWGFGSKNIKELHISEKADKFLYEKFELGRLQKYPFDYMAKFAQESRRNNRWSNPTAFYQTPPNVCKMMVEIVFRNETDITKSVCDPCAGTGTMLLEASNYSINLYAQEISLDLCLILEVNGYLYMPWLVKRAPWLNSPPVKMETKNYQKSKTNEKNSKKDLIVGEKKITIKGDEKQVLFNF